MFQSLDALTHSLQPLFLMADSAVNIFLTTRTGGTPTVFTPTYSGTGSGLFSFLIKLGLGLCVFLFARRLSNLLIDENADEPFNLMVGARELQTIAFSVVGLILLMQNGPEFVYGIIGKVIGFFATSSGARDLGNNLNYFYSDSAFWLNGFRTLIALHLLGLRGVIQLLRGGRIILRFEKTEDVGEIVPQPQPPAHEKLK